MSWIDKTLVHMKLEVPVEKRLIESASVAGGLAKASRDYDLVVIGAAKEPLFRKILLGEIPEKVARFSPASVLVVKRYEGPGQVSAQTLPRLRRRLVGRGALVVRASRLQSKTPAST